LDIRLPTLNAGLGISGEYRDISLRAYKQVQIRKKEIKSMSNNDIY